MFQKASLQVCLKDRQLTCWGACIAQLNYKNGFIFYYSLVYIYINIQKYMHLHIKCYICMYQCVMEDPGNILGMAGWLATPVLAPHLVELPVFRPVME